MTHPTLELPPLWPLVVIVSLAACATNSPNAAPTPLGMQLASDGVIYAGVAVIDITPAIGETFSDDNGNSEFDGCLDDPAAKREGCDEGFDDKNGNGKFDPVWIAGFGPLRPALGVHDPTYARALVLSYQGEYLAFVALDVVGLATPRIHAARDALVADGFNVDRLLVSSSHLHQGPDTMGLWGDPEHFETGLNQDYQDKLQDAIEQSVRQAAKTMQAVSLQVGAIRLRDVSPKWYNGKNFGGKNPTDKMHGLINDKRDPVIVSDQLLVLQGIGSDERVAFTLTNWSGHPEVRGSDNNLISSDYVGRLRSVLEQKYGGVALHLPESLGGMQSTAGGDVPLITAEGSHVFQDCHAMAIADASDTECFGKKEGVPRIDSEGEAVPAWAKKSSWEFVDAAGWHLAEAATLALDNGERIHEAPIRVMAEDFFVPVENAGYNLLAQFDVFELGQKDASFDPEECPEYEKGTTSIGCLKTRVFRIRIGPIGFSSVPGEVLPEVSWGLPTDDPRWVSEAADPKARGPKATYFVQHPAECNNIKYSDCQKQLSLELSPLKICDCTQIHAWPYTLSPDASQKPLLTAWDKSDVRYRAIIGMADNYLSYIIPETDFNMAVSLFTDDGDHYEDTVSPSHVFGTRVQQAHRRLDARW